MSLGIDLMEAVKRGGMNKWKALNDQSWEPSISPQQERREAAMSRILVVIGKHRLTADEVHSRLNEGQRTKFAIETVRSYLITLLKRGEIQRSDPARFPHYYFK